MLVEEVFGHLVNVFPLIHLLDDGEEIGFAYLSRGYATRVAETDRVEDASDDRDGVFLLELGMVG